MRRAVLIVVVCGLLQPALAAGQVAESLREQARIRETLLARQVSDLGEMREELRGIWTRLEQQTGGLLLAQREGETVDSLRLRDTDLRKTETELLAAMLEAQQQRSTMLENRTMIAAIELQVQRLAAGIDGVDAPLNGAWRLVVEQSVYCLDHFGVGL